MLLPMNNYYVYILASKKNGSLYIGVTNDISRRVVEHQAASVGSHTKKYGIDRLVYFELTDDIKSAIAREKQLKTWNRAWKIQLIESQNPNWHDLFPD